MPSKPKANKPASHDLQPARQAQILQPSLLATIDLALVLKQLHWNLRGTKFQIVHEFLDLVIDAARATSDAIAERIVTVGEPAHGLAHDVAKSNTNTVPDGFVTDTQAVELASAALAATINTLRDAQQAIADIDAVSEDLVIGSIQTFEKQHWMLRSHLL